MSADLLAHASRILRPPRDGYALAYGSHARGTATAHSDLDLLLVTDALDAPRLDSLIAQVKQLHTDHGLGIDEEVAYPVKLHATHRDIVDATHLLGFDHTRDGTLLVRPVDPAPAYLNSGQFKLRLILTALAGPHVFLGGNPHRHTRDRHHAHHALTQVALHLLTDRDTVDTGQLVDVLITHPVHGVTGQDHLGYTHTDTPLLYGILQHTLTHLAAQPGHTRTLEQLDPTTYRRHHPDPARIPPPARIQTGAERRAAAIPAPSP